MKNLLIEAKTSPVKFLGLVIGLLWLTASLGFISPAHAEPATMVQTYQVLGVAERDGSLAITERLSFEAEPPASIEQRLALTKPGLDYSIFEYEIQDLTVKANDKDVPFESAEDGDYLVITIDSSQIGQNDLEISYRVIGAAISQPEVSGQRATTEVSWRVLQGLNLPVKKVTGEIQLPDNTRPLDIDCVAGPPVAPVSCSTFAAGTFEALNPQFSDGPRGAGEIVALSFVVDSAAIAPNQTIGYRWTLDRAFSADPVQLVTALAAMLIVAAGLYLTHRKLGVDPGDVAPISVAEFEPIGPGQAKFTTKIPLRPGEVGTLLDERVDPIDISATIIDLAQRGAIRITEKPAPNAHSLPDWTFQRLDNQIELCEYERILVDALTDESGEPVAVSTMSGQLTEVIPDVQDAIYAQVANSGWFVDRPDQVRAFWRRIGIGSLVVSLVVLAALVAFTNFGLLALVLLAGSLGLIWISQQMPRRTRKGVAVLRGLEVLSVQLQAQPTEQVPKETAYDEISGILPYAIVLGGTDRWIQALADADDDPGVPDPEDLDWYHAPNDWMLADLPNSLDAFLSVIQGKLVGRH